MSAHHTFDSAYCLGTGLVRKGRPDCSSNSTEASKSWSIARYAAEASFGRITGQAGTDKSTRSIRRL